jgi:hypothetical protein
MESSEMDNAKHEEHAADSTAALVPDPHSDTPACEPGCSCNSASKGKGAKIAITLLVFVAVVAILIYKVLSAKPSASNNAVAEKASVFSVAGATTQNSSVLAEQLSSDTVRNTEEVTPQIKIGEYLNSLSDLNKVAISQDAVFIFIPNETNKGVPKLTNAAMLSTQKTLKKNNITLGLYTLPSSSPDYAGISKQVQAPAVLVASKGKGISAVSGEVTETKLLQAFMASSSAGGCGPSGCGPSSAGCK